VKTNIEIVREFYETLDPELVAPDMNWRVTDGFSLDSYYHGRQAMQKWVTRLAAQFDNWQDVPDQLLEAGDMVIGLGHYQCHSKTTGEKFDVAFSHFWFLKDEHIIKLDHHVSKFMSNCAVPSELRPALIAPDALLKN
jgi:uncharacterized protein